MTQRVLCFGGRDYSDAARVAKALNALKKKWPWFVLIHGGARGADSLAAQWGADQGFCVIRVDANWDQFAKRAGFIRNGWMVDFCAPTLGVAFPGGAGTADMADRLRRAGVPVWVPY